MEQASSEVFYDFDLTVRASSLGLYTVSMVAETGKKVAEEVFQHFDDLRDVPRALAKAKSSDPEVVPTMYDKLKDLGRKLHKSLFSGKIGREVRRLMEIGGSVALRLRIEPPDMKPVPWEAIFDGKDFFATSPNVVLSRIPPGIAKSDRPVLTTTPKLACVLMRPFLEEYGDENRWEARKAALRPTFEGIAKSRRINVSTREVMTLKEIRDLLGGDEYEIVHLFCQSEDTKVLLAENELISVAALTAELSTLKNLLLAVLSPVWGHNVAVEIIARDLVTATVPAALSVPMEMGPAQEEAFLAAFYDALGRGKRLDYATSLARRAVVELGEVRSDFMLPVFFMSVPAPFAPPVPEEPEPPVESTVISRLQTLVEKGQGAEKALALANIAYLHQHDGEYEPALENYQLAIPLFEESQDNYNLAVALGNTATVFMERQEFSKAVGPIVRCVELRKALDSREETVAAYRKLGYCYRKLGKLGESVESYRSALELSLRGEDKEELCDSHFDLGVAYAKIGDLSRAADMLRKSLDTATQLNDKARMTDALEYLGAVHFDSEDYKRAKEAYKRSRALRQKLDDETGLAITLNNLGNVEQRTGHFDAAQIYYEEAMRLQKKVGSKVGLVSSLHNLAHVQYKLGDIGEAVFCALKAKNAASEGSIEDIEYMSSALLERMRLEVGQEKYESYLSKAQERLTETD